MLTTAVADREVAKSSSYVDIRGVQGAISPPRGRRDARPERTSQGPRGVTGENVLSTPDSEIKAKFLVDGCDPLSLRAGKRLSPAQPRDERRMETTPDFRLEKRASIW